MLRSNYMCRRRVDLTVISLIILRKVIGSRMEWGAVCGDCLALQWR
jgi:hypothetical protein